MEAANKCGGCKVCCTVLEVKTLCKATGHPCDHLSDGGCGIYADRPDECQNFTCLWLGAMAGHEPLRPDRSGLLMFPNRHEEVGDCILCHELVVGASEEYQTFLYGLSEATGWPVVVRWLDGTHKGIYTSKEQLERLLPVADLARTV